MKVHQLSYIIRKEKKLKEVIPNNKIVKLDTTSILGNDEEDESSSSLSITIGDININIQDNFDERLLTKVIKVCKDASRF